MNAIPYTFMGDEPAVGSQTENENASTSPVPSAYDSFLHCMSWVDDYDDEWTSFIEQHTMKSSWAHRNVAEDEAPLRVWNSPRS